MAIDCVSKFNQQGTVIRQLQADTPYSGTIANLFDGAFFKFEMAENETIYFTLEVSPNTTQAIQVEFTLYRKDGEDYTNLGTSISDEFYNTFNYDATPAEYYICITSDWSVDYTLSAEFTDYPFVLIADCDAYAGSYMPPTDFAPTASECDSPVFYQIIEGTLPKGLEFAAEGIISGYPEEQDCEPVAENAPPSFTWWDEENMVRKSWGIEHRIVIRAALLDAPGTFADREFFICVHNNWDYDRDHYMGLKDSWEIPVYLKPGDEPTITFDDDEEEKPLELTSQCDPCDEQPYRATLEELKELAKIVAIEDEFKGIVKINSEGLCEVCEEPEESTVKIELETIELEHCTPCEEPITVEGLKPLPKSLCDVQVETVEVEQQQLYVPGIPELCYPGLVDSMMTEKVCTSRASCPTTIVYPEVDEPKKGTLKPLCPPCEE